MQKIDSHTHTFFSFDGKMDINTLMTQAVTSGYEYLAITEHLDCDYLFCVDTAAVKQLDLNLYKQGFNRAVCNIPHTLYAAFGIECGYSKQAEELYCDIFSKTEFDVIINSVHSMDGMGIYHAVSGLDYGSGAGMGLDRSGERNKFVQDKKSLYLRYLKTVLDSIRAEYPYHIIGHFGYIARYTSFLDSDLFNPLADMLTEEILKEIIARGKTLEINAKGRNGNLLPFLPILKSYYRLGGRDITFGSDAHSLSGLGLGFAQAAKTCADIGFKGWTVYIKGKKKFVPF